MDTSVSLSNKDNTLYYFSFQTGECLGNASNRSTSIHGSKEDIEEGEFVPCKENIQMDTMLGSVNGAASYGVAALNGNGSRFWCREPSIYDGDNKDEAEHESREGFVVEVDSLAYSKRATVLRDVKGTKTCCSLVVLCRLHQVSRWFILLHGPCFYLVVELMTC
jgi:hypothetical protein